MEAVPHMRKIVLAGGIAVLAVLGTSATAHAKGCSDNQNVPSSVAQYTEQQPTACGTHATGQGNQTRKVPKTLQHQIDSQGGQDAKTITKIVSSEAYGAPTNTKIKVHKVKVKKVHKGGQGRGQAPTKKTKKVVSDAKRGKSSTLAASVGVITDGSDGRLIGLIVLMVGLAVVVVVSALRRRRVTR
jgi:hypothetical protein